MRLGQIIRCNKCGRVWQLVKCHNCQELHPEQCQSQLADKLMDVCLACATAEEVVFLRRHISPHIFGALN